MHSDAVARQAGRQAVPSALQRCSIAAPQPLTLSMPMPSALAVSPLMSRLRMLVLDALMPVVSRSTATREVPLSSTPKDTRMV